MSRFRVVLAAAVVAVAVVALSAEAATPQRLAGTVGPGFTITLKKSGKTVRTLKAGRYRITVTDRSEEHDFHLRGPGVNKVITSVDFVGRKTVTVRLKRGRYTYVCDPHADSMKASFRVR